MKNNMTICYIGIFDPKFSRNAVYIKGLRQNGVEVRICTETKGGLRKYLTLIKKFLKERRRVDVIIIGYSGHILVPFVWLLNVCTIQKPIVFDALCSFYEGNILSRDAFKNIPFRSALAHCVDRVANFFSDFIMLETQQQSEYYVEKLGVKREKCIVALTGVNDDEFYFDQAVPKLAQFTVLFRGKFTPEAGLQHILKAAALLRAKDVFFRVIGYGWGRINDEVQNQIRNNDLTNVEFFNRHLPIDELRKSILECHVSLGQFENHERLTRTIPHKAYEAMAMKIPYITGKTQPVSDIFEVGKNCLLVPLANPQAIADAILKIKDDSMLAESLARNGYEFYQQKLTPQALAQRLLSLLPHSN